MNDRGFRARLYDWLLGVAPWLLAIVFFAGITHVISILAMPHLAPRDSYARIEAIAAANRMTALPSHDAAPGFPFEDPALARGVCRYDLSRGALRLRASLEPDKLMLISFHSRFGEVYYSMTDRSATRGRLETLLLTRKQIDDVEAEDSEDELPKELRIVAPTPQGFVLFRALAEFPSGRDDALKRIMAIACSPDREMTSQDSSARP